MNSKQENLEDLLAGWKQHPVTQEIYSLLRARIQERKDLWANGNLMAESAHVTAINSALNQGYIRACEDLLEIQIGDLANE